MTNRSRWRRMPATKISPSKGISSRTALTSSASLLKRPSCCTTRYRFDRGGTLQTELVLLACGSHVLQRMHKGALGVDWLCSCSGGASGQEVQRAACSEEAEQERQALQRKARRSARIIPRQGASESLHEAGHFHISHGSIQCAPFLPYVHVCII